MWYAIMKSVTFEKKVYCGREERNLNDHLLILTPGAELVKCLAGILLDNTRFLFYMLLWNEPSRLKIRLPNSVTSLLNLPWSEHAQNARKSQSAVCLVMYLKILSFLLNPHSRHVKIDACILQFLCHMTSDVKFSNMLFFLFILLFKSFIPRSKKLWVFRTPFFTEHLRWLLLFFSETKK